MLVIYWLIHCFMVELFYGGTINPSKNVFICENY